MIPGRSNAWMAAIAQVVRDSPHVTIDNDPKGLSIVVLNCAFPGH